MTNDNDNAPVPAGWYPSPDGGQRYWNGSAWLDLPAPDATGTAKRRFAKKPIIITLVALVLAVVGGTVAWKVDHDSQIAAQEEAAEREA